jgi:hypothetical protein
MYKIYMENRLKIYETLCYIGEKILTPIHVVQRIGAVAPQARFELATLRLTAGCSTIELLRN